MIVGNRKRQLSTSDDEEIDNPTTKRSRQSRRNEGTRKRQLSDDENDDTENNQSPKRSRQSRREEGTRKRQLSNDNDDENDEPEPKRVKEMNGDDKLSTRLDILQRIKTTKQKDFEVMLMRMKSGRMEPEEV